MRGADYAVARCPSVCPFTLLQTISDNAGYEPTRCGHRLIALDFSKAFDTVRQANLLRKIALLNIPDPVYWLVEFF